MSKTHHIFARAVFARRIFTALAFGFLVLAAVLSQTIHANANPSDAPASSSDDPFAKGAAQTGVSDPFEGLNRFIFGFNEAADMLVIRPVAQSYRFIVPAPLQNNVRNVLRNASSPVILINNILQGDFEAAENTATRFFVNTVVGLGGLIDIAGQQGHLYRNEDFGQTLATWGVGEGPYLVLPLLGPSNLRDSTGLVADTIMDPLTHLASDDLLLGRTIVDGIDTRARNIETLDTLKNDSLDFYARVRSVYDQARHNAIRNAESNDQTPDFGVVFPDDDDQMSLIDDNS